MRFITPALLFIPSVVLYAVLIIEPSCLSSSVDCTNPANASAAKCVAEQAVIDCTTSTAQAFTAQHDGDISKYFTPAGIDWAAVEQALVNLVAPEAICVLEDVVTHYLGAAATDAGASAPTQFSASPELIHQKATELEAKRWPGKKAKLK